MRITFVQYGDYREAWHNFERGGDETYAGQRYSVEEVRRLAEKAEDVCVISVAVDSYEEVLSSRVRALGRRLYQAISEVELVGLVAAQRPTHLVARSPIVPLLRWGLAQGVRTLPMLATSFPREGLRGWLRHRRVAAVLNSPEIRWVGNHQRNSARALVRIGIDPAKVVPWDWPPEVTPHDFPPKERSAPSRELRLFYAGRIQENKGVGDCLRALALLRGRGLEVSLTLAGPGDLDAYRGLASELGVAEHACFLGRIPHREVVQEMHHHDVVLVPSQHTYPEGLPLTIYDAFCSRSPLVASDHPMFRGQVADGETALVFRASDAASLAASAARLAADAGLYAKLSTASLAAWERLQIPVRWGDMLERWLRDTEEDRRWLTQYSLASGRYEERD
jgi:glycosyltransferase involved in cell wall biosynthesis